jgi:hypothetical protein
MLPSRTTDELEGRSWGMVGAMTLRSTWKKWREVRVISERGDDKPCREGVRAGTTPRREADVGRRGCVAGNEWVMDGRGGHAG